MAEAEAKGVSTRLSRNPLTIWELLCRGVGANLFEGPRVPLRALIHGTLAPASEAVVVKKTVDHNLDNCKLAGAVEAEGSAMGCAWA